MENEIHKDDLKTQRTPTKFKLHSVEIPRNQVLANSVKDTLENIKTKKWKSEKDLEEKQFKLPRISTWTPTTSIKDKLEKIKIQRFTIPRLSIKKTEQVKPAGTAKDTIENKKKVNPFMRKSPKEEHSPLTKMLDKEQIIENIKKAKILNKEAPQALKTNEGTTKHIKMDKRSPEENLKLPKITTKKKAKKKKRLKNTLPCNIDKRYLMKAGQLSKEEFKNQCKTKQINCKQKKICYVHEGRQNLKKLRTLIQNVKPDHPSWKIGIKWNIMIGGFLETLINFRHIRE